MRVLIIGPAEREKIRRVITYAEQHPICYVDLWSRAAGKGPAIGDLKEFVVFLPDGFRVVFSIEEQSEPLSWCRHISISVPTAGMLPSVAGVAEICSAFGFVGRFTECIFYPSETLTAINVIEPLDHPRERIAQVTRGAPDVRAN